MPRPVRPRRNQSLERQGSAVGTVNTPPHHGTAPPPLSTIVRRDPSPTSTLGVESATRAVSRRAHVDELPKRCGIGSSISAIPGGQSSEDESNRSPMPPNAMMPPPSPKKRRTIVVATVGIPTSKVARVIKNMDEDKWNQGYDSDGELGPFFDAVENEPDGGVEEEDEQDGVLPPSMLGISTTAQGSAPRKATSRKINPAKVAKKRTRS